MDFGQFIDRGNVQNLNGIADHHGPTPGGRSDMTESMTYQDLILRNIPVATSSQVTSRERDPSPS